MGKKEDVFKLIFNTEGDFVDVEPPKGKELKFGPTSIARLSFNELRDPNITLPDGSKSSFEELMATGNIEMKLLIINAPGRSICGGSCGGIAFSWC
jgi:hypothetical protein